MKAARILWTIVATASATVVLWLLYLWTMGLFAETPYHLWPFPAFAAAFNIVISCYIVVGTAIFVWKMWHSSK